MESRRTNDTSTTDLTGFELPSLFKLMESNSADGFDSSPAKSHADMSPDQVNKPTSCSAKSTLENIEEGRVHSISISMPPSPALKNMAKTKKVLFTDKQGEETNLSNGTAGTPLVEGDQKLKQIKFYSQPMPMGTQYAKEGKKNFANNSQEHNRDTWTSRPPGKQFDSFKTWSGKLERQMSNLVGKPQKQEQEPNEPTPSTSEAVPVDRYFDALEGPELEVLRASEEELVLPKDKPWPFLLRFPISAFGISLGICSQAILWKALATSSSSQFLKISQDVNYALWCIGLAVTAIVSIIYSLKIILYFEGVRREYYHPIRINFFFAPWIAGMFLLLGLPTHISKTIPHFIWYLLMTPILGLELKIYGQWMSGGQRRLSKVANPTNHLAIVGNFVGALLGATIGLVEGPIFFFAVGVAHYAVLFVTLYQRLPTNETLPKELHPVFFLFVAAPSVASMAWAKLQGSFDYGSRICYFVALFLYVSLAVRVNFFRGFKFSLAWWAYTFPMTGAAIATIKYANEVQSPVTKVMLVALSAISTFIVLALFLSTLIHAFVLGDLFPNDIAIAISRRRPKGSRRRSHRRWGSADTKDVEAAVGEIAFTV